MAAWLTFLRERVPLLSYLALAGGLAGSGTVLAYQEPGISTARPLAAWAAFGLAAAGVGLFLAVLRVMDEFKDYETDLVAHPDRPLPRGVLEPGSVARAARWMTVFMLLFGAAIALRNAPAGICYLLVTGYLWLMFREFFAGGWLSERILLYAASHQVILLPVCAFCVLLSNPAALARRGTAAFAAAVLGAFFAYEVCRKLDPGAHPLTQTYLSRYGRAGTAGLVLLALGLSGLGAGPSGTGLLLWPLQGVAAASLSLIFLAPQRFKIIEGVASLSLLVHTWAIPALYLFTRHFNF